MDFNKQAIWIDLDNSPHVPLFVPLIRHYRAKGVEVILTARDHSQTIELLHLAGLDGTFEVIGHHYGKSKPQKIRGLIERALQLVGHLKGRKKLGLRIAVAVSHGSRSMVLAAKWLKIPVITMYDYEFTETGIFNRFSDKVLVPDSIPNAVLDKIGLSLRKRTKYPGLKEELYLRSFVPEDDFRDRLLGKYGLPTETVIAVVRPPATTANYHSGQSDVLLESLLRYLLNEPSVFTMVVPRTAEQAKDILSSIKRTSSESSSYSVLDHAVDGLNLAFAADLLISGGGTMNREAALLGVPVYSIFAGRQGALDAKMENDGLITFIRTTADIDKIELIKRPRDHGSEYASRLTDRVERFVIKQIDDCLSFESRL